MSFLLLALLAVPSSAALAADDAAAVTADELGLEVEVGFAGQAVRRAWLPVSVFMEPDHAFQGELRVAVWNPGGQSGQQAAVQPVDVPAGSAKVFRFVVPPNDTVEVQVVPDDGEGVRISIPNREEGGYLVGLLDGTVPTGAPPLRAYAVDSKGAYVPVAAAWLDHPGAFNTLSAVVVSSSSLGSLTDEQRRTLASDVVAGLDLVVVADSGAPPGLDALGLPDPAGNIRSDPDLTDALAVEPADGAWSVRAADVVEDAPDVPIAAAVNSGLGRVIVSGVALGVGPVGSHGSYWGLLLQPSGRSGGTLTNDGMGQAFASVGEGLRSGQLELPPIGWFALFLLAYVVVVGPVNGIVLARAGRRELAWVTVPAVTVVFATGAWLTSADQSSSLGMAGTASYWIDGHGTELAAATVRAPRADEHTVTLEGSDWAVLAGAWSSTPTRVTSRPDGVDVELHLEAMQVGTVVGQRPTTAEAPLAVTAAIVGDRIDVEVTNRSGQQLSDVRLRAGTAVDDIGSLASGETRTHRFETRGTLPVEQQWADPFDGIREPDGSVLAPRSLEALLRFGVLDGNPGLVWVVGTFDPGGGAVPVLAGGARAADQGSFVAVGVTPAQADPHLSPFEVGRQLITSGFGSASQPGPLAIEGQTDAVLRYRVPANGELTQLTSTLDRGQLQQGMGEMEACHGDEVAGDEGMRFREVCGPEPLLRAIGDACPEDANHCALQDRSLFVCRDEEPCHTQPPPPELLDALAELDIGISGLEIYDREARTWTPIADVFGPGEGTVDAPARYLSPLGDVYVRVTGEFFPFDFSGRGLGGRFTS